MTNRPAKMRHFRGTAIERLGHYIAIDRNTGCWEWPLAKDKDGYGKILVGYKDTGAPVMAMVHRFSYEHFVGTIPEGLQIDHLCRNRGCVNPEHLEAVTCAENIRRGYTGSLNNANRRKVNCPKGHEYNSENTYLMPSGGRQCRTCVNTQHRASYHRRRKEVTYGD